MNYHINQKNQDKLSILAFGGMRFPEKDGKIDYEKAVILLDKAIELGINYFDTAYFYHGGESEQVYGRYFEERGSRDKVFIADKMPIYSVKKSTDFEKFFAIQLKKLRTNYIDYYLLHCVTGLAQFERLKALGIFEWAEQKKAEGAIKNLGFSYHGPKDDFLKIIELYPWDFVMIQYNYLDEQFQAGKAGFLRAKELGVPVMIMEPLQGGNITLKLPDIVKEFWAKASPSRTLAEWALKWLWNQEGILTVLSGMTLPEQLIENCNTAATSHVGCLSEKELSYFYEAKALISSLESIPCTACGYCVEHCKKRVNIPACFTAYNKKMARVKSKTKEKLFNRIKNRVVPYVNYMTSTGAITKTPSTASLCTGCGACHKYCPQDINIAEQMKKVKKSMENSFFRLVKLGGKIAMR